MVLVPENENLARDFCKGLCVEKKRFKGIEGNKAIKNT
jgi:hypothetical protein